MATPRGTGNYSGNTRRLDATEEGSFEADACALAFSEAKADRNARLLSSTRTLILPMASVRDLNIVFV